jgi:hypothetical protein
MKKHLFILILFSSAICSRAQYDSLKRDNQKEFKRRVMMEVGLWNLNDGIEEQIKDFMYSEGLRSPVGTGGGGGGWFGGGQKTSVDAPRSVASYSIISIMIGYTLTRHFDAFLGYRSGFDMNVDAGYDKTVPISLHLEDRNFMAIVRFHFSSFEIYSGMLLKEMISNSYDYPDEVKTKTYVQHKSIPGITGGINLTIPKRPSVLKVLVGYNFGQYFEPYSLGSYTYQKQKYMSNDIVYYELPPLDINLNDHSFYFGFRLNIPVQIKAK